MNGMTMMTRKLKVSIFLFIICWYYVFSESLTLRPFVLIVWPSLLVAGCVLFNVRIVKHPTFYTFGICLSIIVMSFSLLYSINFSISFRYLMQFILYFGIANIITTKITTLDKFLNILLYFLILHVMATYIQVFFPNIYSFLVSPLLPESFEVLRYKLVSVDGAYVGLTNQTSVNAIFLSIGIATVNYKLFKRNDPDKKFCFSLYNISMIILLILFFVALFFTQRRGSVASMLVVNFLQTMRFRKSRINMMLAFLLIILIIIYVGPENIIGVSSIYSKFVNTSGNELHGRSEIWNNVLLCFKSKPLLGHGINTYSTYFNVDVGGSANAHNSYIQTLFELGIIGFAIYYFPILIIALKTIYLFWRRKQIKTEKYAIIGFSFSIQLYIIIIAIVEGVFSITSTVFILFIAQLSVKLVDQQSV